ncbi:MAG: hypothetical protein ACREV6_09240 [Clostridium sp.]|uniref:hypothetical protein n=1 Tax=Clostridium sp. TaxID=1506 RepID=UPI003D6D0B53
MKKKSVVGVLLVGVLAFGAGSGTMAKYVKNFNSQNNTVKAAKFNVKVSGDGKEFKDSAFALVGADLKPGTNKKVYDFEITKETEVPVEYNVVLAKEGELLKQGSPVNITLQRYIDNKWETVDLNYKCNPKSDNDKFQVLLNWPEETTGINDVDFAGKEGKINISVTASQVIEKVGPTAPLVIEDLFLTVGPRWSSAVKHAGIYHNTLKYYKNDKGLKVVQISDLYNDLFSVDLKNVLLTQKELNSNEFILTCQGTVSEIEYAVKTLKVTVDQHTFEFKGVEDSKYALEIKSWNILNKKNGPELLNWLSK